MGTRKDDAAAQGLTEEQVARQNCEKIGLTHLRRHIFLCGGPKCTHEEAGTAAWQALKEATAPYAVSIPGKPATIARTKVSCLRVCADGPIAVVYPEGIWYHRVGPEECRRITKEHLLGGKPVEELILARSPLKP